MLLDMPRRSVDFGRVAPGGFCQLRAELAPEAPTALRMPWVCIEIGRSGKKIAVARGKLDHKAFLRGS